MQNLDIYGQTRRAMILRIVRHPVPLLITGVVLILVGNFALATMLGYMDLLFGYNPWAELLSAVLAACFTLAIYRLFVHFIEGRQCTELSGVLAAKEWSAGASAGFAAISLTVLVIALFGGYRIVETNPPIVLLPVLAMAITSGVIEEILFRGLFFRLIEQWLGSWSALIISALLFGLLHVSNPNSSWLAGFAIALEAGILLGALYMLTRRLWAVIGLHMAWNFAQGGIYGISVSGFASEGLIVPAIQGSDYLTGGAFGGEASIPAIIICTALGLFFIWKVVNKNLIINPSWDRIKGLNSGSST